MPDPGITVAIIGGVALVAAAVGPSLLELRKWKSKDQLAAETSDSLAAKTRADTTKLIVDSAGQLVLDALQSQLQATKDRAELRQQLENLQLDATNQKIYNQRAIEGLQKDHKDSLGRIKSDYESEFDALHRQIGSLIVTNTNLNTQLREEKEKSQTLQRTVVQQQEQLASQQVQISAQKAQIDSQQDLINNQQTQLNSMQQQIRSLKSNLPGESQ